MAQLPVPMGSIDRHRPLRVTALGTSSFVMPGGFIQPFVDGDTDLINVSLEASGACLIGAHLAHQPWRGSRFLLLGFANMEEVLVHQGSSAIPEVANALRCAIDAACRLGCVPILVQFPHRRFLDRAPVSDAMRTIFAQAGLPVLDVGSLIAAASVESGVPREQFFHDDTHLKTLVAHAVGAALLRALPSVPDCPDSAPTETSERFRPLRLLAVGFGLPSSLPLRRRKSPQFSCLSVLLRDGMALDIPAQDEPCSIVGVVVNSLSSRGRLVGEEGAALAYSLPRMPFSEEDGHVFLNARPVPPVALPPRGLRLRPAPRLHGTDGGPPQTELCGLILRSDAEAKTMVTRQAPADWLDLTSRLEPALSRQLGSLV